MTHRFIIDASLALSWCIADEIGALTESILDGLGRDDSAIAPSLWVWEINNALYQAERQRRLSPATRSIQSSRLQMLPIQIEDAGHRYVWHDVLRVAQAHKLTIYDATYLEMALRYDLPLGSLDRELRKAAERSNVDCLPHKLS